MPKEPQHLGEGVHAWQVGPLSLAVMPLACAKIPARVCDCRAAAVARLIILSPPTKNHSSCFGGPCLLITSVVMAQRFVESKITGAVVHICLSKHKANVLLPLISVMNS